MKVIKYNNALKGKNSEKCKTLEYSFMDKDIDLGIATISGRYPDKGYGVNLISKELIYVLEGSGTLNFENEKIEFSEGDSILIEPNEKYYYDTKYCKISMSCTPAWSMEQHKLVE
jgi:mannose-6-phosphate isomerase class I